MSLPRQIRRSSRWSHGVPIRDASIRFATTILGSALLAICPGFTYYASADDLSDQLLTAAAQVTNSDVGKTCLGIDGLYNLFQPQMVEADTAGDPSTHYTASIQGAYLGDMPAGRQPPPFIQALIENGVVTPIALISAQITVTQRPFIPQLQDLMKSAVPAPPLLPQTTLKPGPPGEAFIVTGPDAKLFTPATEAFSIGPAPLDLIPASPGENPEPPSGLWKTEKICYTIKPDRVLEYGDFHDDGDGTTTMDAFILFHPSYVPNWISDYRVTPVLHPIMLPNDVRFVKFRNDGDGWRPFIAATGGTIRTDLHIIGGD